MNSLESNLMVFPDGESMSKAAADMIAASVQRATLEHGAASIALSGGSTPRRLYQLLAEEPWRAGIAWENVHLFWADERPLPPDHEDSNYRLVGENLLDSLQMPCENIHRVAGELDPKEAASFYEDELRRHLTRGRLDIALLGMGDDGHTASLLPNSPALQERDRWVVSNPVAALDQTRITMTFPLLEQAAEILFLVSGEGKAEMLRRVIAKEEGLPAATLLKAKPDATWIVDEAAASKLDR